MMAIRGDSFSVRRPFEELALHQPFSARVFGLLCLVLTSLVLIGSAESPAGQGDRWLAGQFSGSRTEVQALMQHYEAIQLTAEQEKIRRTALQPMPAPCCNNFSAATCCCECNLSRSLWGLSKFLIVEKEADAEQVRAAVEAWVQALNPSGYEGKTCSTGQCNLPFKQGGCGGMNKARLIYD